MRGGMTATAFGLIALMVTGCDNGGSAVQTRDRAVEAAGGVALTSGPAPEEAASLDTAPAARTVVTGNRRETVDAKVQRLFDTNGADFGARSAEDYLAKLTAFTGNPPADAEMVERPNGDKLYYQASTNTFAVVARNGTPRTMFKPRDGAAYWTEQKAAAPTFGQRRRREE